MFVKESCKSDVGPTIIDHINNREKCFVFNIIQLVKIRIVKMN